MVNVVLLIALSAAGLAELGLLRAIVFHQAGGWSTPENVFVSLLVWAALPLIAAAILVAFAAVLNRSPKRILRQVVIVCCAGPLLGYVALSQYSHSTPGFMMLGYIVQWVAVLLACVKLLRTRQPEERDAT